MVLEQWMDNRSVLLLSSVLEGMNGILSVQRREKRSSTKSSVPCSKVVKLCLELILRTSVPPYIVWIESHFICFDGYRMCQ